MEVQATTQSMDSARAITAVTAKVIVTQPIFLLGGFYLGEKLESFGHLQERVSGGRGGFEMILCMDGLVDMVLYMGG